MRFSLRTLLLLVVGLAASLAIAKYDHTVGGIFAVVSVVLIVFVAPRDCQRPLIWGAIIGMVLLMMVVGLCAKAATGVWTVRTYQQSHTLGDVTDPWRPYIIPLGGFLGAVSGLALHQNRVVYIQRKENN